MAVTFLLICGIGAAVFWLGLTTFRGWKAAHGPVFLLCSLMVFSPAESQALLRGMELILYVPLLWSASLLAYEARRPDWKTFLFAGGLATVSTYTFVNGMLVWVVLFPVFFLAGGWAGLGRRKWPALAWLAAAVANGLIYFYHFQFASSNGFWRKIWTDPWPAAHYFFAFLGGPLANVGRSVISVDRSSCLLVATEIGCVLFLAFLLCLFSLFRLRKQAGLTVLAWPWMAVGAYGLLSAAMATAGRSLVFGVEQALSPRYAIFGISLMIALAHLMPLLAGQSAPAISPTASPATPAAKMTARIGLSVLGLIMAGFFLLIWPSQALDMDITRLERLQAKSCLDFINVIPERPAMTEFLSPLYPHLKQTADELEKLGFLDRPLLDSNRLSALQVLNLASNQVGGSIESDRPLPAARIELSGWAVSPFHSGPADCVLLTYETAGAEPVVFDLLWHRVVRRDLVARYHDPELLEAGWLIVSDLAHAPRGRLKIRAWAYDTARRAVVPLRNTIEVDNE